MATEFPRFIGCAVLGLSLAADAPAADTTVQVLGREAPQAIDASFRDLLQKEVIQLNEAGQPSFQFWFRAEVPLSGKPPSPDKALEAVPETTFMGVVTIQGEHRDYRNNAIDPGTYVARMAFQPRDGDHMGTSVYPYFLVLTLPKYDKSLDAITAYKPMVKASGRPTATGHPVVLSLRPASAEGDLPALAEPAPGHKSVRVTVPARVTEGGPKVALVFEIVYQGKGKT